MSSIKTGQFVRENPQASGSGGSGKGGFQILPPAVVSELRSSEQHKEKKLKR